LVAFSTPTTAGKPYSCAITAPWVISLPTSVTKPFMDTNNGVQPGSVKEVYNFLYLIIKVKKIIVSHIKFLFNRIEGNRQYISYQPNSNILLFMIYKF
jgi:hypothetical protein